MKVKVTRRNTLYEMPPGTYSTVSVDPESPDTEPYPDTLSLQEPYGTVPGDNLMRIGSGYDNKCSIL